MADELYGELTIDQGSERWHVIHTKPQCEKKLAGFLLRNTVNYYLPMIDSHRLYKYRKVSFTKPMFQGYLFARFDPLNKTDILISGYVVNFLKVPNEQELIDELLQISLGRMHKAELVEGIWLEKGWQVVILDGPLKGVKGVVQSQTKLNEVTLQVNVMRQAIVMRVNPADVKVLGEFNYY
jgi:transcription antitermination factor NusG